MASSRLSNSIYRIQKDKNLSEDEKQYLLNKINHDNIDDILLEKNTILIEKTSFLCDWCHKEFKPSPTGRNFLIQKYCCVEHQELYLNRRRSNNHIGDSIKCPECGNHFILTSGKQKYCETCTGKKLSERKKVYKAIAREKAKLNKPPKELKVKEKKIPKPKIIKEPKPKVGKRLTEEQKLRNKIKRRQEKIYSMTNLFNACKKQLELDEFIAVHFPGGLN